MTEPPLTAVVKDLERRWGLTLVSFVPTDSVEVIQAVQRLVRDMVSDRATSDVGDPLVDLYEPDQLHCTHLTLARSNAWGPVRAADFVKPGVDPQLLCGTIHREAAGLGPITLRLDRIDFSDNGFQLLGRCADDNSLRRRSSLLQRLNAQLPENFNLTRRAWDTDPARHAAVHMRLAFVKRPVPGYETLAKLAAGTTFEPITISFTDVALVHHRYRSLRTPHLGCIHFPLDEPASSQEEPKVTWLSLR